VAALRSMANRFGSADGARKLALLRTAAGGALCDMGLLVAYHDVLLCLQLSHRPLAGVTLSAMC
jgi:hypothetical protein